MKHAVRMNVGVLRKAVLNRERTNLSFSRSSQSFLRPMDADAFQAHRGWSSWLYDQKFQKLCKRLFLLTQANGECVVPLGDGKTWRVDNGRLCIVERCDGQEGRVARDPRWLQRQGNDGKEGALAQAPPWKWRGISGRTGETTSRRCAYETETETRERGRRQEEGGKNGSVRRGRVGDVNAPVMYRIDAQLPDTPRLTTRPKNVLREPGMSYGYPFPFVVIFCRWLCDSTRNSKSSSVCIIICKIWRCKLDIL